MASWQNDLKALVEETQALANSVEKPVQVEPFIEPVQNLVDEIVKSGEPTRAMFTPMNWARSERDEIKQRVANFKAHQQKLKVEREAFFLQTIIRVRASIRDGGARSGQDD